MVLLVYVDDIIVVGPNADMVHKVQLQLQSLFKLKVLGDLKYFLGLEIACSSKGICLSQRKYTLTLLEDIGFIDSKPASLPMESNMKLSAIDGDPLEDGSLYRRLMGHLMYLTISWPNIAYSVHKLSQFMSSPRTSHLVAVHHLLRYLKSSLGQGLLFPSNSEFHLKAYADVN